MIRRLTPLAFAVLLAACSPGGTPAPSSLAAGSYTSAQFKPAVTYTLPTGWTNPHDAGDYLDLVPAGSDIGGIFLFRDPQAASQDTACPASPAPGIVASSSTILMTWIRGRPSLTVSSPRLVTVGGLPGVELDVGIKDGWTASCPYAPTGVPTVPLFLQPGNQHPWTVAGTERLRIDLLDLPGGGTVVVDVDAFDGAVFDSLVGASQPIVRSMRFATG